MKKLITMNVFLRSLVLWLAFMLILWSVFAFGWATHPQAWNRGIDVQQETGWPVFWFIIGRNLLLLLLIAAGNIFVRFGGFTPGLVILFYQALAIGWTAGTNGFMEPFPTVAAANAAFLRIGLWETTAYVLVCAATLPKSLLVAADFPAKAWTETRRITDLRFDPGERLVLGAGGLSLLFAALSEAFLLLA
ncbi:MAG TPA: hypothetical protein PKM78_08505 [Anaerolineae bacterium]|nr:hypothetical protein [Anaerolineae bacterium]HNU03972.1 hypothetical protein [Anaerolineae bacterium]